MILATVFALALNGPGLAKERPIKESFSAMDVFKIAYAANPVMSPNGQLVAFDRFYMDVMTDTRRNHLWLISSDGSNLRQVSKNFDSVASAAFTPSGDALAFVAVKGEESYIYMHKLDTGERVELGEGILMEKCSRVDRPAVPADMRRIQSMLALADAPATLHQTCFVCGQAADDSFTTCSVCMLTAHRDCMGKRVCDVQLSFEVDLLPGASFQCILLAAAATPSESCTTNIFRQ